MAKKINDVELRKPQTKQEELLLGFIMERISALEYGSMTFEIRVHNKKMTNIKCIKGEESFDLHNDLHDG